jgi:Tfp pilus assembly protein FimT
MAIAAILSGMAYVNFTAVLSDVRLRAEAGRLEAFLWRARREAAETKRPYRVVLDCAKARPGCELSLESAVVDKSLVTGWRAEKNGRHGFRPGVRAAMAQAASAFDGDRRVAGVHYAIFMPGQKVYSDPRPFGLFLYYGNGSGETRGYLVSVNNETGRIDLSKDAKIV